ncbi:MAG: PucR family transcriptional regulator [Actinomycetes bacterium]
MEKSDNGYAAADKVLPAAAGGLVGEPPRAATIGRGPQRVAFGLRVQQVLEIPVLAGSRVLAGSSGLDRVVTRLNVMEVPDILPWVKPDELLLTTGYPLRHSRHALADLVGDLDVRGVSALAVKLGRYLEELPATMLARADRLGFPVVTLPAGVAFDDILNQVLADVLDRQASVLARSEEVHQVLVQIVLGGGGLAEVTSALVGLLGGAVQVAAPDGRILQSGGDVELLAAAAGAGWYDGTGRFQVERLTAGAGTVEHPVPGTAIQVAVAPVVAGSFDHGRLVAWSPARQIDDLAVHTLERAATVAALAITRELAVGAVQAKYRGDFLRDVLSGRAGDPGDVLAHGRSLGWDFNRALAVVVAEGDAAGGQPDVGGLRPWRERFATAWTTVVRGRDPEGAVADLGHELVAVVGVPPGTEPGSRCPGTVDELITAVRGDGGGGRRSFSAGVSRVCAGPDGLVVAYGQAHRAVRVGRRVNGPGRTTHFDALGVFRLLSLVPDPAELRGFAEATLGELAVREDAEALDLRNTLTVLLATNLNVAETARTLHFHYNTLRYRIGKLERMIGPFTGDSHLRLSVSVALAVLDMKGI